jgi:hypothetical protein
MVIDTLDAAAKKKKKFPEGSETRRSAGSQSSSPKAEQLWRIVFPGDL